jgi:hypothetical protein
VRKALLCIIFALAIDAAAVDFGLLINLEPEFIYDAEDAGFRFTSGLTPWFSAAVNEKMGFYISTKVTVYDEQRKGDWTKRAVFELERMELSARPRETVYLNFGRQRYRDSGGMIAAGFFDGFHGTFGLGRARISGGVFSTGLLHKESVEILMTDGDRKNYGDSGIYFASNRLFMTMAGEFPDLSSRMSLVLSGLAQFDLNGYGDSGLHSQYLEAHYGIEAMDTLRFTLTALGGVMESDWEARGNFALALGADWEIPGSLPDMLTGEFRWGSGVVNRGIGPFMPISGISQGTVFTPTLSGLMTGRLSYAARPLGVLSFNMAAAAFFRTDLETFADPELDAVSKDRFLGGEAYGQLIWAPQSPLRITAGVGVFLPGGAFIKDAEPRWKASAGFVLSL